MDRHRVRIEGQARLVHELVSCQSLLLPPRPIPTFAAHEGESQTLYARCVPTYQVANPAKTAKAMIDKISGLIWVSLGKTTY